MALTAAQEHYLKRELLRLELARELEAFNDVYALRKFGTPFSKGDPENYQPEDHAQRSEKQIPAHGAETLESDETFPLLKYFFNNFVTTIPFLSEDRDDMDVFWIKKVQVFYEHFMSLNISDAADREELTKRKKFGLRLSKLVLMIYNSGIGTVNEAEYYERAKYEIGENLQDKKLDKLMFPTKETLQDHISQGVYINGMNVNVAGVRRVTNKVNGMKIWGTSLNISKPNETYYEFIVKTKTDLGEGSEVYVARRYNEFKELHHALKKKFPGKHFPALPSKIKSEVNVGNSTVNEEDVDDADEESIEEERKIAKHDEEIKKSLNGFFKDLKVDSPPATPVPRPSSIFSPIVSPKAAQNFFKSPKSWVSSPKSRVSSSSSTTTATTIPESKDEIVSQNENRLPREKLRVALRSYLRKLLKDVEIANCEILKEFLYKSKIFKLSNEEISDIKIRENLDLLLLSNQIKFQNEAYLRVKELKNLTQPLKKTLLTTDDGIIKIFAEFKEKSSISQLSPMLVNFIEWCKIEIAATIYQLFLANDNSFEFYSQMKRFHKLMPYSVMINILRFTNPMSIMKSMLDLLMANPFGGKSLLQTLLSGILSDDIKHQSKVINELETKIGHEEILQRFRFFIFDCKDQELISSIKMESRNLKTDIVLTLIITPQLSKFSEIDDETVGNVFESYNEFKKLSSSEQGQTDIDINYEKSELFSNLKSIFKLYVKKHDKDIMRQLWSEPELTAILKDLLTMFYQPLVTLFRNAHVDVAFKHFENFMDELINTIDRLNEEIYVSDTSKIVDEIMQVLNNHQDEFYDFLHDVYVNDSDLIFEKLIIWINDLLKFLRHSKSLNSNTNYERMNLNKLLDSNTNVDKDELISELDDLIEITKSQRQYYAKKLERQREKQEKAVSSTSKDLIQQNWDAINNIEIFETGDFGLNEHDLLELSAESEDEDETSFDTKSVSSNKKPLRSEDVSIDEIAKLVDGFRVEVVKVLKSYD